MNVFASWRVMSCRRGHLAAERRQQIGRAELHVVQHFGHRVAVHEIGHLVAASPRAGCARRSCRRTGCAGRRGSPGTRPSGRCRACTARRRVNACSSKTRAAASCRRRTVDLAVGVARHVLHRAAARRLLVEPMDRHDRKELIDRPAVRQRLEQREVAEVAIDRASLRAPR